MQFKKCELDLFPTPVSLYDLSAVDITSLLEIIEQSEKKEFCLVQEGVSTFGSDMNLLDHPDLVELKSSILWALKDYRDRLGIFNIQISDSWFNFTKPGGRLELHRHEGSIVSGSFYPIDNKVSPLLFKSPILPHKMNELYKPNANTQHAFGINTIVPSQGMLVLFPSWLEHKTDTEIGERLVVSFNTFYSNENLDVG